MKLQTFKCFIKDREEYGDYVTHVSSGKAKVQFWRSMLDCYDRLPYTLVRCKVVGSPVTSEAFKRNAIYRKIPFAHCGMIVEVNGCKGAIVGHNSSANLDVLFMSGRYNGQILNCHPHSGVTYFDSKGQVIPISF